MNSLPSTRQTIRVKSTRNDLAQTQADNILKVRTEKQKVRNGYECLKVSIFDYHKK